MVFSYSPTPIDPGELADQVFGETVRYRRYEGRGIFRTNTIARGCGDHTPWQRFSIPGSARATISSTVRPRMGARMSFAVASFLGTFHPSRRGTRSKMCDSALTVRWASNTLTRGDGFGSSYARMLSKEQRRRRKDRGSDNGVRKSLKFMTLLVMRNPESEHSSC